MTFALRGNKDILSGNHLEVSRLDGYTSANTQSDEQLYSEDEVSEEDEEEEIITSRSSKTKKARKSRSRKKTGTKLSAVNVKLFKQLGPNGDASVTEVQQLLDEGADPNCLNKNEFPPLYVAVKNNHVDAIETLVHGGAKVNAKGPNSVKGNTALHEAVRSGPAGIKVIDVLLRLGADQNVKNDRAETPYDLAVKAGYENISKRFVSALGQSQLDKIIKSKKY